MNTNSRTSQRDLIPPSMTAQIPLGCDHPLVQAADSLDWEEIQRIAQEIRRAKLKNAAGRPPALARHPGGTVVHGPAQASLSRDGRRDSLLGRKKTNAEVFV